MRKKIRMKKRVFGRLTVIDEADPYVYPRSGKKASMWLCRCECGNTKKVLGVSLRRGNTKSCNCLQKEVAGSLMFKHGYKVNGIVHVLYTVWQNMKERCYNINHKSYRYYGGRGISVCEEWKNDSNVFVEWCLSNGWKPGLEIDREENDGDYSPSNCHFVTRIINATNRRVMGNNKCGYSGVFFHKRDGVWRSYVNCENKKYNLGDFNTMVEAVRRRNVFILLNELPHKIQIIR